MEIYKLTDEVPDKEKTKMAPPRHASSRVASGETAFEFVVTDLKQGVKNPNRVNVFVNEKFAFSLDVAQVVDFGIKIGKQLTEEELAECKKASEFGKEYQRALEWVLVRPRSARELKDYLKRRDYKKEAWERKQEWEKEREVADLIARGEEVDAERMRKRAERARERREKQEKYDFRDLILERLCERGYVDDRKFAEYYVENRFVKKGVSRRRLAMELMKKGVAKDIIEEVLPLRDDEEEILKMIAKKRGKYDDEKLVAYLCRQGFAYDLAQRLVRESGEQP